MTRWLRAHVNPTRRHFIKLSVGAGSAVGLGIGSTKLIAEKSVKPLRILILGGTGFTGPYQVRYALSRSHKVTTFNRGKTPGTPTDPVQFIDARDLAEWTIRMAEKRGTRIYNATGPAKTLVIGDMLGGIKTALSSNANFTWVTAEFLKQQNVQAWSDMSVWAGDETELARSNISRALAKGLTFRPLAETARDTLAWFKSQPQDRQSHLRAGLTPEREAEVLTAWHKQQR